MTGGFGEKVDECITSDVPQLRYLCDLSTGSLVISSTSAYLRGCEEGKIVNYSTRRSNQPG